MRRFTITHTDCNGIRRTVEGVVFSSSRVVYEDTERNRFSGETVYEGDGMLVTDCVSSDETEPWPDLEWLDEE